MVRVFVAEVGCPRAMRVACPHVFDAIHADYGPEGQAFEFVGGCERAAPAVACGRSDWFRVAVEDMTGLQFELFDQFLRIA